MPPATLSRQRPAVLTDLDPADVVDEYARRAFDSLTDAHLCEIVADVIAEPKVAPADSFVLHAPLELLARTALLPLVEPHARELARQRLVWLGASYAAAGPAVGPRPPSSFAGAEVAVAQLSAALSAGDVDDADDAAGWLATALTPVELSRALADCVLPRLSAAGHGSIFLYLLPRVAPRSAAAARMVRGLVRELAREPDWNLTWYRHRRPSTGRRRSGSEDMVERLLQPPPPGDSGSNFIHPTMSLVDESGQAADLLDSATRGLGIDEATQALMRVAAWSMLQDAPEHAPYGWTHCLTMPQAALGVHGVAGIPESGAEPEDAIAVAATYVLGFRATLGRVQLARDWAPDAPRDAEPLASLQASPAEAASAAWHASGNDVPAITARLATAAAVHPDAHLAKYTLACLDAGNADPGAGRLYLAAAAHLGAWWGQQPPTTDPLLA